MSPMSGVLLIAALWIPSWTRSPSPPWLPGGDLFQSLSLLGQGIVPPAIDPVAVAVAGAMALLGMALFARGRWNPR